MSYSEFSDYYVTYDDAGVDYVVLGRTEPVAKKEHTCSCCRKTIQPGQRYRRYRLIVEGDPGVQKECPDCMAISDGLAVIS